MRRSFGAKGALLAAALLVAMGALFSSCGSTGTGYPTLPGNPSEQAPSLVMRLSHPMPPAQDNVLSWIVEEFARSVRERSEGRLKVYVYPNSQLVRLDDQVVDAVATGRVDAAIIPGRYVEKAVPAQAIESLPFIFNSWDGFKRVSQDEEFRNTLSEEYHQRNLVLIDWNVSGWGWFASDERPVILPGDLEALRVAVMEREEAAMVAVAGGIPVRGEEAYAGAQRGAIDAAFVATSSFVGGQMPQVFEFYPKAQAVPFCNLFLVNKDFWDSLPQELQEAVRDASHEFLWEMWLKFSFDTAADEWIAMRGGGVSVYEFNADDRAAWIELLEPLEADYASRAGPVGEKLLDIARSARVMPEVVGGS